MAREARRNPDLHYSEMNVMGFSEVFRKLPKLALNLCKAGLCCANIVPTPLSLVDYPGFNLTLASYAHKLGIPVHYFISPKVWAGRNIASGRSGSMSTGCTLFCRSRSRSTRSIITT